MFKLMLAGMALAISVLPFAHAQTYPTKPIRLVVPYAPGGANDSLARFIAPKLTEALGQSVYVDNRPGSGHLVGTTFVAKSPADGYTLLFINSIPHASTAALYKQAQFDAVKSFVPVGMVATTPYVLVLNTEVPAKSLPELVELSRKNPDKLSYSSGGVGASTHLIGEMFKQASGTNAIHVPYKGGGPAIIDIIGGRITFALENIVTVMPHVKTGKLRALAVTSSRRSSVMPEYPTLQELGLRDFDVEGRFGIVAPVGTPADVVNRLNAEMRKAVESPDFQKLLRDQGVEPRSSSVQEFSALIAKEVEEWNRVVLKANIKPE